VSGDRRDLDTPRIAQLEPTAHVHEEPDEYRVEVDVPGLEAGDLEVRLVGRLLHVTGRDLRALGPDSTFEFAFRLPDLVTGDELTAIFADGRLVLRSPVRPAEPRLIEIEPVAPTD
jgi:HSP20 family molecular chaperone IbpA